MKVGDRVKHKKSGKCGVVVATSVLTEWNGGKKVPVRVRVKYDSGKTYKVLTCNLDVIEEFDRIAMKYFDKAVKNITHDELDVTKLKCFDQVAKVIGHDEAVKQLNIVANDQSIEDKDLEYAFTWDESPQDHNFWRDINGGVNPIKPEKPQTTINYKDVASDLRENHKDKCIFFVLDADGCTVTENASFNGCKDWIKNHGQIEKGYTVAAAITVAKCDKLQERQFYVPEELI